MRSVASMIGELTRFPMDAQCYAYEGEIRGVVVVTADRSKELGYVLADETPAGADVETVIFPETPR